MKKVAVIGAGPSGLTSIKCCKEEGADVVCFERNGDPGGLWRYHDEDIEGVASVMKTTIINTSKEISAFSDFPPPKESPNYMHHSLMYKYFLLYAEKFDLLKHIRFHQEVIKIEPSADYDTSGRWRVKAKSSKDGSITEDEFDGVMVCIGHHVFPKIPTFPGMERFKGKISHTHSLKSCENYKDQTVVVVGIGNSGVDAAVDSTFVTKKVYLSTRRGSWIRKRLAENGMPADIMYRTRLNNFIDGILPFNFKCYLEERKLQKSFDHAMYGLKPQHRSLNAHPTVNDALPNCILSGKIAIKGNITRFEEDGVVFDGESDVTQVDSVILATGYFIKFPFLQDNVVSSSGNRIDLYKYMFPPHLKHPTLALMAVVQQIGPLFPLVETQARWYMQILNGKKRLPSVCTMQRDIAEKKESNAKRFVLSTRHTIQVDYIPFIDELASQIGAKPNLWKMMVTDPKLFWVCLTGPCLPYQFRLQGPHPWPRAREAILTYKDRVKAPLNTRLVSEMENKGRHDSIPFKWILRLVLIIGLLWKLTFS